MKVYIMMGIPGSGKTTWIKENLPKSQVCSADHLFEHEDGSYQFDRTKLGQAHAWCLKRYLGVLQQYRHGPCAFFQDYLVVDNTNTSVDEIAPYIALAQAYDMEPEIVHVQVSLEDACGRCIHSVPPRTIAHMKERLERTLKYWPARWPKVREV